MNYSNIIKELKKYHFLYVTKKGVVLLASGNNLKESMQKVIDKLKPKMDKYVDKPIVRLQLIKIKKELWVTDEKKSASKNLTSYGGPIEIKVDYFIIDESGKLNPNENHSKYKKDSVFITKDFLEDTEVTDKHLKTVAKKAMLKTLRKSMLKICTLENI